MDYGVFHGPLVHDRSAGVGNNRLNENIAQIVGLKAILC